MKLFFADKLQICPTIDLISREIGLFQAPIDLDLLNIVESMQKSDAILVPHDAYFFHEHKDYVTYLNEISRFKPLIFSDRGDFPKKTKVRRSISIRVALGPGEKACNKIVVPYNVESLEHLPLRRYMERPQLSFVGYVPKLSKGRVLKSLFQSPLHPYKGNGSYMRKISLRMLEGIDFQSEIIKRDSYGAHRKTSGDVISSREEYLNSLTSSDFVLAPRGDANQSARFYETLSAGRIPLVPNSGVQFPVPLKRFPRIIQPMLNIHLRSKLHFSRTISNTWDQITNQANYYKYQVEIRAFYKEELEYNRFMKQLFNSDSNYLNRKIQTLEDEWK